MRPSLSSAPVLAALATLVTGALAAPASRLAGSVELTFAAEAGSRWHRVFEHTTDLVFDDLSVVMGGQEIDSQFLPEIDLDSSDTSRLEVTDEIREVAGGRPVVLHRTFDAAWREAEQTMEMVGMMPEPIESAVEGKSPLEGHGVAFTWSDDGVAASWVDDSGGSDELLDGLSGDLDMLAWLPEGEIAEGDSWSVPAQAMEVLLAPGGDLAIELEGGGAEEFTRGEGAETEYDGELTLRLAGIREDDGGRVAAVEIQGEFETSRTYAGNLDQVPVADGTTTVTDTLNYEIEGELVWDLDAGILRSLEAEAEVLIESHDVKDPGQDGPEYEATATLSGTMSFSVSVEPAD